MMLKKNMVAPPLKMAVSSSCAVDSLKCLAGLTQRRIQPVGEVYYFNGWRSGADSLRDIFLRARDGESSTKPQRHYADGFVATARF